MKASRWRVMGGLVALATASAAWPAAVGAQTDPEPAELRVSPTTVGPGETVTVTAESPCVRPQSTIAYWIVYDHVDQPGETPNGRLPYWIVASGTLPVDEDGNWDAFEVAAPSDPDSFEVSVGCFTGPEGEIVSFYESAWFEVVGPTPPPSTSSTTVPAAPAPPPAAPPARPVPGRPSFAG